MLTRLFNRLLSKLVLRVVDIVDKNKVDRLILPMSSGVNIKPNTSAVITVQPQLHDFRAERIIFSNAENWVVNDITIGNVSQFVQPGDIPGEMFSSSSFDGFVRFNTCPAGMNFSVVVTYVGCAEQGEPLVASALGRAVKNEAKVQRFNADLIRAN